MRGATGSLPAGMAIVAAVVLALVPASVRADETGPEPSPSPTAPPTPSPSRSPLPSSSATTTAPAETPSPSPPQPSPDVVGVESAPIAQRPVAQAGSTVPVAAVDDAFRPTPVTVTVGTTIVWTNQGQNPHTVTADDRSFDSGTLESGQRFAFTFDRIGEVPYYCQIHGEPGSGMTGLVIVQAAPGGEDGEEPSPAGSDDLPATGGDPVPLAIAALASALAGLVVLRASRRTERRR